MLSRKSCLPSFSDKRTKLHRLMFVFCFIHSTLVFGKACRALCARGAIYELFCYGKLSLIVQLQTFTLAQKTSWGNIVILLFAFKVIPMFFKCIREKNYSLFIFFLFFSRRFFSRVVCFPFLRRADDDNRLGGKEIINNNCEIWLFTECRFVIAYLLSEGSFLFLGITSLRAI